ncbi:phosphoglycerate mutase-like protein, partial [Auriscalpium vulgare]
VATRVYIVRHGETDANNSRIIQGHLDTPLNGEGIEQSKRVAEALRAVPFHAAFSSDLSRASQTAEIIVAVHPGLVLRKQVDIRERNMGMLQGKGYGTRLPADQVASMEKEDAMARRAAKWWAETMRAVSAGDTAQTRNVLVVSHGGFIGVLVRGLLRGGVSKADGVRVGQCLNTAVAVVEVDGGGAGALVRYGDVSHLAGGQMAVEGNAD